MINRVIYVIYNLVMESRFEEQVRSFKDRLRTMIARAELPEGARIDEPQLRQEIGVTVRAARQALTELAREGLIIRKRHVGTYVSGQLPTSTFPVLPKIRSVGILSSCRQSFFATSMFGRTVLTGIQLSLQPPAQTTFFIHPDNRSVSIDDLPYTDADTIKRACQGVIAIEAYNAEQLNDLARSGVPLVAVDYTPAQRAFDAVEMDHFKAGYLATRHLLSIGHRRIAWIGEGPVSEATDPTWQARLNGYLRAMVEAGVEATPRAIVNIQRSESLLAQALPPVQKAYKPTAYVLSGGHMAVPVCELLRQRGHRVPDDVSLAAADSSLYEVKGMVLSQVRADYEQLGRNAMRVLASRLACKAMPPMQRVLEITFAPGQTSRPV